MKAERALVLEIFSADVAAQGLCVGQLVLGQVALVPVVGGCKIIQYL